jgi:hypothetical protein
MKRWIGWILALMMVMAIAIPSMAEEFFPPPGDGKGVIGGRHEEAWRMGVFDQLTFKEIADPAITPSANTGRLYAKDNGALTQIYWEDNAGTVTNLITAGATAWDDVGDPDANTSITMAGYTTTWTSTLDNGTMFKIDNTDADLAADTILLALEFTDDGDANGIFLRCTDANGTTVFNIGADGATTITGTAEGTNALVITGGDITITDGDVVLSSGDINVTGNLTVSGTTSLGTITMDAVAASTAGATITIDGKTTGGVNIGSLSTGGITLSRTTTMADGTDLTIGEGILTIDNDQVNETALTITSDAAASGGGISVTSLVTTAGAYAVKVVADSVTTGDVLYLESSAAGMTTGNFINAYNGAATVFEVGLNGVTTIAGAASADALIVTAGDVQLTAGDIDIDLGIITIDNTADEGNTIKRNNATGTAAVLEIEQTHATGGIALLVDTKNATANEYAIDITSSGATQIHFTANGAAGDGMLYDATNAWTGQALVIDAGPWLGTAGEGAGFQFTSDNAATSEAGTVIRIKLQGTGVDAAAIDGKGLYIEDEAAATAGSYLVKLDTLANTALHISNAGAAADGIKIDVADSYTGQGLVADLGPWLGTSGEGFINITSDNAATVPAGQFIRMRQLGTGQHAAAIAGTMLYMEDDATAPAAGTSYVLNIDATNIEAIHVDTGKVLVDETVTATGGVSAGNAADSFIYTDTVELSNVNIKALRATPITLVAAPGAANIVEVISVVLILDYGTNVLTESADNLVVEYASGQDITAAIEMTGFIDQAADQMAFILPAGIATMTAANALNDAVQIFNTGDGEIAGNAANDTTMTVKISYRIHAAGL